MSTTTEMTIDAAIERFITVLDAAEEKSHESFDDRYKATYGTHHEVAGNGKKYARIARIDTHKPTGKVTSRSVTWFVKLADGSIWYPAGWKGPALNFSRGNVYVVDELPTRI